MRIDLTETNSSAVATALLDARRHSGSPAVGMVLTLVLVASEDDYDDALSAATDAAREHPCRILTVIRHEGRARPRLDAEITVGGEAGLVERVVLRLAGRLGAHAASVVLPLLLPDTPVVVWWPGATPADVAHTELGQLAQRRVTDAAATSRGTANLLQRAASYQPGDTDFAWSRLTPWRTLLASTLDQYPGRVRGGTVAAERGNPSADLLAVWLQHNLKVPVERTISRGPGITSASLEVPGGRIAVHRPDGVLATLSRPGDPDRHVSLPRRSVSELLAEELRRLDPDEVYDETLAAYARTNGNGTRSAPARERTTRKVADAAPRKAAASRSNVRKSTARGRKSP
ncbi:MAG: glucose-6-phosphate dehydrogenase assembly protein OpcA [Streptosporangiales bacterium]|nr:glucose-6-phosphate dehydrogenase assembly protein OpcA [Streptosporangiales bacterium]MBO0891392.1 glucose-6-phosphate dehydrogenase assembly protein OpcA [Acidothermales bacterium]